MENGLEKHEPSKSDRILQLLDEVKLDFDESDEMRDMKSIGSQETYRSNILIRASLSISEPSVRGMIRTLDPNDTIRKFKALKKANLEPGKALMCEAALIIAASESLQNPSEESAGRFLEAALALAEMKNA